MNSLNNKKMSLNDHDETWKIFRNNYILDQKIIHFTLAIHVPHSLSLNKEIDYYRKLIDTNPDLMRRERHKYTTETLEAAARYLGTDKSLIALTDSSTMSLSLILNGFEFQNGTEILTTDSEHYSLEKLCESSAKKYNLTIKKINISNILHNISKKQIVKNIVDNINDKTCLIAISWVNSKYGIKFPLKEISKELKKINFSREENKKILLCVDGVHGFGIENLNSIHDLGVDFFAAGCHKWLFGPRGTGLLWCSERGWKRLNPIIPSFEKIAWDHYLEWDNKKYNEDELIKSRMCTPGGFKTFEYFWALKHAFETHEKIGKVNIQERVHYFSQICKNEIKKIPNAILLTPISSSLSSGFICFKIKDIKPEKIVAKMTEQNIIIGQSPYKDSCLRITPSIYNTEEEVLFACNKLFEIVNELNHEDKK